MKFLEMKEMISKSFEPVYVTRRAHPKLVKSLKIKWYPTTVLVAPNNKVLDMIEGYVDAGKLKNRLQLGIARSADRTQTR